MSIAIIVNPVAGGVRPSAARHRIELAAAWRAGDGSCADVFVTKCRGHARELAAAAARRAALVVAWGGDGTVNEVAGALAFGDVPMGIVPAGSGNGLALELKIPFTPREAIDRAVRAPVRRIDLGDIDGHLFVNIAGIGVDADVAAEFNGPRNRKRGFAGYASITARTLRRYRSRDYDVAIDSRQTIAARRALMVTFANSTQFGNGARIAPRASIDDGCLDLVVIAERSRWRTVCALPRLFMGSADRVPGYWTTRFSRVVVRSDAPLRFHADGEPFGAEGTVTVQVRPAALPLAVG